MILRSQSRPQPHKSKPISIRQIMNQHVSMMQNDERILPPSLTDPPPPFPPLKPQAIASQALKIGMPIAPPSHIQSETSVQLSDYQDPIAQKMPSHPRRIRIFDINSYHGRNYPRQPNPVNPIKNAFSFGSQNPYQPINPVVPNQNENISKNYSMDPSQNKSSSELYQTVRSMKKTVDNRNNSIYEQSLNQKQPSGILLRSNKFPAGGPGLRDSNSFSSPPPILKQTTSEYAPPILEPRRSTQYQSVRSPSLMNSNAKKQNSVYGNPLNNLSRSVSPSPVPVYQNQFHKVNRSGDSFDNKRKLPSYQAYYSKPMNLPQTPNFEKQSPYLDALLKDFNEFQARQKSGQGNMLSRGAQSNSIPSNIDHPPAIQQALLQSFGHKSMPGDIQRPPALQQAFLQSFGQNQSQPSQPSSNFRQYDLNPPYPMTGPIQSQHEQYTFLNDNRYQPINQLVSQQYPSPGPSTSPIVSLSPFQQNQREELRQIPKRFEYIQKKVLQHQKQINQIGRRLSQTKTRDDETQKNLLGQLIQKQQQLNQKQRQINSNLERISKMQNENNQKKQQILQYQLELQRARRVEELSKQNQRLYHELIRKENSNISNTRDMSLPTSIPISVPMSGPMNVPMSGSIMPMSMSSKPSSVPFSFPVAIQQPKRLRNEYSNRSISALQAQRFDEIWESDGGSIGSLLSPFSINPDYY